MASIAKCARLGSRWSLLSTACAAGLGVVLAVSMAAASPLASSSATPPRIEVVFALDTTGSMGGLLEGAKREIWAIADRLAAGQPTPQIRMGLVAYRDRGDQYVTQLFDLSDDIDAVHERLLALRADGGGDTPEAVNAALYTAVTGVQWSRDPSVYRVVFLVGDAPPHTDYADDVPYDATARAAARAGIVINTVRCGTYATTRAPFEEIARLASGRALSIQQDGGLAERGTPFDAELARMSRLLTETVVPYGTDSERSAARARVERTEGAEAGTAAARLSYLRKTRGRSVAESSDLVSEVLDGRVDPSDVAEAALPATWRELSPEARQTLLEEKLERRRGLAGEIEWLVGKRDAHLRERGAGKAASEPARFDDEVLAAIRAQAGERGIRYE